MATSITLNAKNLSALGADKLAELLLDLAQGDATMKRRLRLELAGQQGGANVAAEIRKRLISIARSKSFVDWRKVKALAQDLEAQRSAIMTYVTPAQPDEALELLWRLLDMAPSVYERCDDSNGAIGSVLGQALEDIAQVAPLATPDVAGMVDRIYDGVRTNDYGQFDNLIPMMAQAIGQGGLAMLKAKFEQHNAPPLAPADGDTRKIIGISARGPVFETDYTKQHLALVIQSALADIADASGDVDGYAALYAQAQRANPAIAARIAERLVNADRPTEALAALAVAQAQVHAAGRWPDWQKVRIDALQASGMIEDAQRERWQVFVQTLQPDYLKALIKHLPDFDDMEAEAKALAYASRFPDFHRALSFLVEWPALDEAARMILERHLELDGDYYGLLTPAAEALEQRHPLAATLLLRAMIDFSLNTARFKRYPHAARHLRTCAHLAGKIGSFGDYADHPSYESSLRARHGRKIGFWDAR